MKHYPLRIICIVGFLVVLLVLIVSCKTTDTRSYSEEERKVIDDMEKNCKNMEDNSKCYVDLAISTNNSEYCNKIRDSEGRENCEKILATMQS